VIVGDGAIALAQLDGKVFYLGRAESGALTRLGSIEGLSHVMSLQASITPARLPTAAKCCAGAGTATARWLATSFGTRRYPSR
jgi:hypothetical protein